MAILPLIVLFSPAITLAIITFIYWGMRLSNKPLAEPIVLVFCVAFGGIILALISFFIIMVLSIIYDANQGPLAFFFIYGPLSFSIGTVAGFIKYNMLKPKNF